MSRQGALIKNTAILSFGTVVPRFVNLVTLPILTGCLSRADYGTYDLVVSMVTLLLPVATLQLQAAAFRFLIEARGDDGRQRAIVTNILVMTTGLSVVVLVALFFLLPEVDALGRLLICGYYLLDILVATFRQIARGLSKNAVYSASVILNSVSECAAVVGFVLLLGFGLSGALAASLLGQATSLVLLAVGIRVFSFLDLRSLSKGLFKELVAYSWPLIPNSLSSWAISMSDRLVLTLMLGIESSALYAAAMRIPNMLGIFQSAFSLAWQENASLSNSDADRDEYYSKTFDMVFNLLAGGLALLIAASPLLFSILIQGDYEESYVHMNILFLGALAFKRLDIFRRDLYRSQANQGNRRYDRFRCGHQPCYRNCLGTLNRIVCRLSRIHALICCACTIPRIPHGEFSAHYLQSSQDCHFLLRSCADGNHGSLARACLE